MVSSLWLDLSSSQAKSFQWKIDPNVAMNTLDP